MIRRVALIALLVLSPPTVASAQSAGAAPSDRAEVLAVVGAFFDAMRARDAAALESTLLPGAVLVNPMRDGDALTTRVLTGEALGVMVRETGEAYDERMPHPQVRLDSDLAHVWGRYAFRVGERITNCGANSFQVLRTPGGWRIAHIASTIERDCPSGAPGEGAAARTLTREQARALALAAMAECDARGWRMSVAVVDAAGDLVAFERVDGVAPVTGEIARGKARTAARFRLSTGTLERLAGEGQVGFLGVEGVVPLQGGLPIVVDGMVIGAIGVSGRSGQEDESIARAAIEGVA